MTVVALTVTVLSNLINNNQLNTCILFFSKIMISYITYKNVTKNNYIVLINYVLNLWYYFKVYLKCKFCTSENYIFQLFTDSYLKYMYFMFICRLMDINILVISVEKPRL